MFIITSVLFLTACNSDSSESNEPADRAIAREDSWWLERHENIIARDDSEAKILFLGDSITQNWEKSTFGYNIWQQYYGDDAVNLGFSGDKTQHLLWRLEHGEIDDMSPEFTILLIGTNNAQDYSAAEIASGVSAIIDVLEKKLPNTHLIVHRIFPRDTTDGFLRKVNNEASILFSRRAAASDRISYLDINEFFLDGSGSIPKDIMADGLHPSTKGYAIWANELSNYISLFK